MNQPFKVELLSKDHDRSDFDCGEESLNLFLRQFARQNAAKELSRTYVAVNDNDSKIYGFYTLSSGSVGFQFVPDNLPRYPVPVVHLGRLAIDKKIQNIRLGQALLFHALQRSVKIAEQLGIYAVEVYALNEKARQFYLRFGFTELRDDRDHLYITIKEIKKVLVISDS